MSTRTSSELSIARMMVSLHRCGSKRLFSQHSHRAAAPSGLLRIEGKGQQDVAGHRIVVPGIYVDHAADDQRTRAVQ
jgi:hypothetical protein